MYGLAGHFLSADIDLPLPIVDVGTRTAKLAIRRTDYLPEKPLGAFLNNGVVLDGPNAWIEPPHAAAACFVEPGMLSYCTVRDVSPTTCSRLVMAALPCALASMGVVSFHAGAVADHEGAQIFLGESGTGKSTLSAALAHKGDDLLSDDVTLVTLGDDGSPIAWKFQPEAALNKDSYELASLHNDPLPNPTVVRVDGKAVVRFGEVIRDMGWKVTKITVLDQLPNDMMLADRVERLKILIRKMQFPSIIKATLGAAHLEVLAALVCKAAWHADSSRNILERMARFNVKAVGSEMCTAAQSVTAQKVYAR